MFNYENGPRSEYSILKSQILHSKRFSKAYTPRDKKRSKKIQSIYSRARKIYIFSVSPLGTG